MNARALRDTILSNKLIITAIISGALVVYLLVNALVSERLRDIELSTRLLIAEQEATLIAIAETTARNGADAVTESIVRDCNVTEREEFDELLSRLNAGLLSTELKTLERLFGRCGAFYSERKTVMVARLAREIEVYESYISQLSTITGEDHSLEFKLPEWQVLAAEERTQSELFTSLVQSQDEIITVLLAGESPTSERMQEILQKARETQEALMYANKQALKIRSSLVPL